MGLIDSKQQYNNYYIHAYFMYASISYTNNYSYCTSFISSIYIYVTGFAKTLHLHTSDFSDLVTHNSRTIKDIAVKFLHIVQQ